MQQEGYGSGLCEGMRVLYWPPGSPRSARVTAVIEEMPTGSQPLYVLDVRGQRVEASWFSIEPTRDGGYEEPW